MITKKVTLILSVLIALGIILTACAQPETIIETVTIVETVEKIVEGETVVEPSRSSKPWRLK